jgi:hypothetical protein
MYISLSLQPDLLRTSFKGVRAALVGAQNTSPLEENSVPQTVVEPTVPVSRVSDWIKRLSKTQLVQGLLTLVIAVSLLIAGILIIPDLYFRFSPADTLEITPTEEGSPLGGEFAQGTVPALASPSPSPALPPQDFTLPEGRWLVIPRIGVRTELQETENSEEALAKGVWMVPEYGQPGDTTMPMILAAHRFGWQWWWQTDYWKYHSFYLLPDTEPGDLIEIIDDQRKYTYEIYAGEEGEEITDYDAHLILYTCKFLNSPSRHFRYARLVDWTKNTQG